ncbi:MAG: endolytic transglycosylase MltG [Synergistaceae bacterium]|nr:endolytic transglycosylase MltG [Synergistaceae bacterium]
MNKIFSFLLFVCAVAFGVAGIFIELYRESIPERAGELIEIRVEQGQSARDAAAEFERAGAVTSAGELAKWMARIGIDKKLLPGVYRVTAGRPQDVAVHLAVLKPEIPSAIILPGATFDEIAGILGRSDGGELLESALGDDKNFPPEMKKLLPENGRDRIVLLAPETYAVVSGDKTAGRLVADASAMWWKQHGGMAPNGATGDDINSLGILASIVQKEALAYEDRPVIAGVFKNRLDRDMPLQSCATVVYAWRLMGVKKTSVSYNDVKVDSPFNTYVHKGLPPENIGVPGRDSWDAVLSPADTDMLFFFAKADGRHVFTRTYKEHLAAQKKENGQ